MIPRKIRRQKMKKIEKNREHERQDLEADVLFAVQKLEEIVKAEMPKSWRTKQTKKGGEDDRTETAPHVFPRGNK
jgi:hypothetical protein